MRRRFLRLLLIVCWPTLASAQTFAFTDDPVVAGVTLLRAVHIEELRGAVSALRARHGLPAVAFADPVLTRATTPVRGIHIVQLRSALEAVFDTIGRARPTYTDPAIGLGVTAVRAVHITEIRAAIRAADIATGTSLVGAWHGQTSQANLPFALYVDVGGVIGIDTLVSGGINCLVGGASDVSPAAPITDGAFSFNFSAPNLITGVVTGSFNGAAASGTIVVNYPSVPPFIGCINPLHVAWTATHTDPGPIPVIAVSATDANASEAGDEGVFTISRIGSLAESISVRFGLTGTASIVGDYESLTTAVIPAGQASTTLTVRPIQDIALEPTETVVLTLVESAPYTVGSPSRATVTIEDQPLPVVTVTATDSDASEAGLDVGAFTFTRTGSTAASLFVSFSISGTASLGGDYESFFGSVTIPAAQASVTLAVVPKQDILSEAPETVTLTLTDPPHYNLGAPETRVATVTIASDE